MSRKILLADDSVTIRKVVELTFMEENYELTSVGDGGEALANLEEMTPDLIIADVHMGEIGGFEVCQESKKRHPEVPVLLLVGTFEPFDPADAEEHGADAFLKKPFDSQDLLRQVGELLGEEGEGAETDAEAEHTASPHDEEPSPAPEVEQEATASAAAQQSVDSDSEAAGGAAADGLSEGDVDRIARRVVELLSDSAIRDVAWEVVPDMAEVVVKDRLRELESQVE